MPCCYACRSGLQQTRKVNFRMRVYLGSMKLMVQLLLSFWVPMLIGLDASAQGAASRPCSGPEFRQFDFWIGEWEVYAGERLVGNSRVERILGSCVLLENWTGKGGSEGKSFNLYNAAAHQWEQTWVDNAGLILHFKGQYDPAAKALRLAAVDSDSVQQRMTFYALPDGTVRQVWESAPPMGDYKTTFDGLYRRLPAKDETHGQK